MLKAIQPLAFALLALAPLACGGGGTAAIGDPCTSDNQCGAGECAKEDPGGQCTGPCTIDSDCGSGNVCAPEHNEMECKKGCTSDSSCRAGYECAGGTSPRKFCEPKAEAMDMGTGADAAATPDMTKSPDLATTPDLAQSGG